MDKMEEAIHGIDSSQPIHFCSLLLQSEEVRALRHTATGRIHSGLLGAQRRSFFPDVYISVIRIVRS